MRTIYTLILTFFLTITVSGQQGPILSPLTTNPVLQLQNREIQEPNTPMATIRDGADCEDPNPGIYVGGETAIVTSGEQIIICPDLFQRDTAYCLNCDDFNAGQLDSVFNDCFFYSANTGLVLERDTMILSLCDTNNVCSEIDIFIVAKRPGQSFIEPPTTIPERFTTTLCASFVDLPGEIEDSRLLGCSDPLVGTTINGDLTNTCFGYRSNRLAETDTVCFELCDQHCVCDTFFFPIKVEGDTLFLPFTDDFSYDGNQVRDDLWLDEDVFVNKTLSYRPPSVGVATFDGLDSNGSPYDGNGNGTGLSDILTSNYLDLSGKNDVVLSFYLQSKGLGYPPVGDADLLLEFKNQDGRWDLIKTVVDTFRVPLQDSPPFLYYEFLIDDPDYLYRGFQFRFKAFSSREGITDLWHLDYLILDEGRQPDVPTQNDLALSQINYSILDRYTHMPLNQFMEDVEGEVFKEFTVGVFNHVVEPRSVNESTFTYKDITNDQVFFSSPAPLTALTIPSLDYRESLNDNADINGLADAMTTLVSSGDPVKVESKINIRTGAQGNTPFFLSNDTIAVITSLENYYAYDDGTAELVISTSSPGYQLAVQYELNVADSLRAVQFHFPHFNNDRGILFNLFVWGENLEDGPIHEQRFLEPLFASEVFDTLQGYTTYAIKDADGIESPLPLPAGKFHIGWQQASGNEAPVAVGFDRNSTRAAGKQFFNRRNWDTFENLDVLSGAVMMRPVFGDRSIFSTGTENISTDNDFPMAYPNPASDFLQFSTSANYQLEDYELRLIDVSGRLIFQGVLSPQLDVSVYENGLYFVELINREKQVRHFQKVMILR